MDKKFIITVDTEGDNLWNWHEGEPIKTENTHFIPPFQDLCENYGFIPTYLTNYEMALDEEWVKYGKTKALSGKCEIGMHLHAWNTPPDYRLQKKSGGNAYITEFPSEIMEQKVVLLKKLLSDNFGLPITSNRSGRWATNSEYFQILKRSGILVDCSVTPQLDLSNNVGYSIDCGNDYRRVSYLPYEIVPGLLEVPMTTRRIHSPIGVTVKNRIRNVIKGKELWLRPINAYDDIIRLVDIVESKGDCDYLEFMIHSSELMPGGSPYFKDARAVEEMYTDMNKLFSYLSKKGYVGIGLTEYGLLKSNATEMNR